jgi:hypothetical protein
MTFPKFLVQTQDSVIHCYFNKDVLLCDLALNRGEKVSIFSLKDSSIGKYQFFPTDEQSIRGIPEKTMFGAPKRPWKEQR